MGKFGIALSRKFGDDQGQTIPTDMGFKVAIHPIFSALISLILRILALRGWRGWLLLVVEQMLAFCQHQGTISVSPNLGKLST